MLHNFSRLIVLFLLFAVQALGQVQSTVHSPDYGTRSGKPLVTAAVSKGQVRLTALALTRQIGLEVLTQTGELVYDSGFRPGNRLEWEINDQQGAGLPDDIYGCIVTIEDLNGAVSHRQAIFRLDGGIVSFDMTRREVPSGSDEQENLTILRAEEPSPFTLVSHDGKEGWIESASGGLNFYAGSSSRIRDSVPQLRLTPEGNLGIGVAEPTATLDVAGVIRASGGFQFSDGSILKMEGGIPVLVANSYLGAGSNSTDSAGKTSGTTKRMLAASGGIVPILVSSGAGSRVLLTEESSRTFVGLNAGHANPSGANLTFVGAYSGYSNTTGAYNSFVGQGSGYSNTGGSENSFVGAAAGNANTTGSNNSMFGSYAGFLNTASENAFYGSHAGYSNTSATGNAFFGYRSGYNNTTGASNSFFGSGAGNANTTGGHNSFFGFNAGNATTGRENSFYGSEAGLGNTTGDYNAFFARSAGKANQTGSMNAFFGYNAGNANLTGFDNSFVGAQAGSSNTTGYYNSFFGTLAGSANTTGKWNSFIGRIAGMDNTTGNSNTFVGYYSGNGNTDESYNTLLGYSAVAAAGVSYSTALGNRAKVAQSNSLVLGSITGVNGASSSTRVGIGTTTPAAPLHVQGTFKVIQSSSPNDTIGVFQQFNTLDYSGFGYFGVEGSTPGMTVSGTSAYATLLAAGSSGSALQLGSAGVIRMTISRNGNIGIGTTSPTALLHVVGEVLADGYSTPSDARLKQDVKPLAYGLDEILHLRPVSFYWRDRNDSRLILGLIAQEVAPVIPEIVEKSKDEAGTMGMNYSALIPVLIKAVQEQQQEHRAALLAKDAEIAALNARLSALEQALERFTREERLREK